MLEDKPLAKLRCKKCGHNVLYHTNTCNYPRHPYPRPRPADFKITQVGCSVTTDGQICDCTGYEPL